jgi:ribulose-5-phosphate 4-epimerase/fuculose-1-phosphate aldolase
MVDLDQAREIVAQSCRIIGKLDMTREPAGHVSYRIPNTDHVLIKGRGPDEAPLSYTTPDDLMIVDLDGKRVEGREGLNPPNEVYIHTCIYKARPDVHSVIHVHPPTVMLFTICEKELLPLIGAYDPAALSILLEGIPRYPRSILISSEQLGNDLAATLGARPICLMRGHGITSVGASVEDATITAWRINDLAEINYRAALLGNPGPIPDEDLEVFGRRGGAGGRRTGADAALTGTPAAQNSTWRYLTRWIEE